MAPRSVHISQNFSFNYDSPGRGRGGCDAARSNLSPPLRPRPPDLDEQENYNPRTGVYLGDGRGAPQRHPPALKTDIARLGPALGGVIIEPYQACDKMPKVTCQFCSKVFFATHSRVEAHMLGLTGVAACTATCDEYLQLKDKLAQFVA
eukprot:6213064-Pleurochrysis_carterae.AAC.2